MKRISHRVTGFVSVLLIASGLHAQHLRIFACAIANDSVGAFMGGSSNGSGLYQSDDTGKTWKHLGWQNIKCYSMDMVQSSNGRILYEATGLGVLRSTDYGEHWKQITDWRVSEVMDVAVNQKNPEEIYIATAHGAWQTRDGGKRWVGKLLNCYLEMVILDSSGTPLWHDETIDQLPNWRDRLTLFDFGADIPSISIVGSLGKGDRNDLPGEGIRIYDYVRGSGDPPRRLNTCQVWTLRSFLITP